MTGNRSIDVRSNEKQCQPPPTMKPDLKQALGGIALLMVIFLIVGQIQLKIEQLRRFDNITLGEWVLRKIAR